LALFDAHRATPETRGTHEGRAAARGHVDQELAGIAPVFNQLAYELFRLLRFVHAPLGAVRLIHYRTPIDPELAAAVPIASGDGPSLVGVVVPNGDRFIPHGRFHPRKLRRRAFLDPCRMRSIWDTGGVQIALPVAEPLAVAEEERPSGSEPRRLFRQ